MSVLEHGRGEVCNNRICLNVEVAEHFVGSPASEKTDAVRVYLGTKKRHGARSSEGTNRYIGRK